MKKYSIQVLGVLFAGLLSSSAFAVDSQSDLTKKAITGDYQAQRNLAYSYVNPRKGEQADAVRACAWYLTVYQSGSPKVNEGDKGNVAVYCSKLPTNDLKVAQKQAEKFQQQIAQATK